MRAVHILGLSMQDEFIIFYERESPLIYGWEESNTELDKEQVLWRKIYFRLFLDAGMEHSIVKVTGKKVALPQFFLLQLCG